MDAERGREYVSWRDGESLSLAWERVRRSAGRLGKMRLLRYYRVLIRVAVLEMQGRRCTSMKSPSSSASVCFASRLEMIFSVSLLFPLISFFSFEPFFAILFFLGFGFSSGNANAFMTGSLKQSRKVS